MLKNPENVYPGEGKQAFSARPWLMIPHLKIPKMSPK